MLTKVVLKNFRAHSHLEQELEPLTVFVGPNASGKTSILDALHNLSTALSGHRERALNLAKYLARHRKRESSAPVVLEAAARANDPPGLHGSLRLTLSEDGAALDAVGSWGDENVEDLNKIVARLPDLAYQLRSALLLRFDARRLAAPSYSEEESPRVESDGSGLASTLAHLKLTNEEVFAQIETVLSTVVPSVQRIRLDRARVVNVVLNENRRPEEHGVWGNRIVLDMKGAPSVEAGDVGEGTLQALGLLTVLHGPRRPRLVLLDDLELALHPLAQRNLVDILRKLVEEAKGSVQFVATSHSPFVLDRLRPEEVRITTLDETGTARCARLTDHPDFERWKDTMGAGEFWSTVGEDWISHG
jgi:predicted ATPase